MKILNISSFPMFPMDHGGKIRAYNLNLNLSKNHQIFQFSMNFFRNEKKLVLKSWEKKYNRNYHEFIYSSPKLILTSFISHKLNLSALNFCNFLLEHSNINKIFKNKRFDIIQVETPWMFRWAKKNFKGTPVVASAHNVEYMLAKDKNNFQYKSLFKDWAIKNTYNLEKEYFLKSDVILACCDNDIKDMVDNFGVNKKKIRIVPNGVNTNLLKPLTLKEKLKKELGFENKKIILYVSGIHAPNIEAMKFIFKIAHEFKNKKNIIFLIAGSIGEGYKNKENLVFTGWVEHSNIIKYFQIADIALSPIRYGSGTDIKLLEYLSTGIPTIATRFGARGLKIGIKDSIIIAETLPQYVYYINKILNEASFAIKLKKNSRKLVIKNYDYSVIAKKLEMIYKGLTN